MSGHCGAMLAPSLKNVCEMAGPAVCHDWWVCHTPGLKSTEVRRETFEQFISSIKTYVGHGRERKQLADAHTQTARRHSTPHATALRFPPAHLPVATEFAQPSLTLWCLGCVYLPSGRMHASYNCRLPPNLSRGNGVISKVPHTAPSQPQVLQ